MKLSSRGPLDLNNPANTTANTTTVPTTTMSAATSVMPYHGKKPQLPPDDKNSNHSQPSLSLRLQLTVFDG